eukprot:CAMPEP_0172479446 /NCGR_PEP_ID=MMETSP1066-20121228/4027_1 /TAXON_ID=671091 /ORGANISM="Coscinodiscus wailesii, Strain CCMP2513" /LENGTH=577 /DNA_ID=CAMNT_0013239927 /DNA_START=377 /DNA_END=2110 /DNA_ORIENTATION=-
MAFAAGRYHFHSSVHRHAPLFPLFRDALRGATPLAASPATAADDATTDDTTPVPITLLSGFLGSGKTTALKNLLENREGLRIGVIVNDVASVNIDAKLIANPDGGSNYEGDDVMFDGGTVELQNGCACCSIADELLTSVEQLVKGRNFDAVVVELSGVADPVSVKENWVQASLMKHPATELADMSKVVTVVDSCTFGTDWMAWDVAGEREGWAADDDDCAKQRKVPELLAEQVEAADVLLINKIDLAGEAQVKTATSVARGLNEKASLFETAFGKVAAGDLIEMMGAKIETKTESGHSHDHKHESAAEESACSKPDCTDKSHAHSHDHAASDCADPGCTDTSHSHSHDHASESDCADPDCTDTSHSHSHNHASSTSTDKLGISSFVYKSAIPFDAQRLMYLLNKWPVPIKDELDIPQVQKAVEEGYDIDGDNGPSPFTGVLRSKGFCWLAPMVWEGRTSDKWRHDTAMYWSHAGKHFGITTAGKWWGTITKEKMKTFFTLNMKEYERILNEDWASEEFGDRRQELVFIGTNIDQEAIIDALNSCLCTDEEMEMYRQGLGYLMDKTISTRAAVGPSDK